MCQILYLTFLIYPERKKFSAQTYYHMVLNGSINFWHMFCEELMLSICYFRLKLWALNFFLWKRSKSSIFQFFPNQPYIHIFNSQIYIYNVFERCFNQYNTVKAITDESFAFIIVQMYVTDRFKINFCLFISHVFECFKNWS